MNKKEAAEFLGISTRLVARYVSQGRLKCTYVRGKTGREANYEQSDLEALKAELEEPTHRAVATHEQPNGALVPQGSTPQHLAAGFQRLLEVVEIHRSKLTVQDLARKPLLTFKEAQIYTGLSEGILNEAIEAGRLKAEKVGYARRVKRSALDAYIEENF